MTEVMKTIAGWLIAAVITVTAIPAHSQLASFDKSELAIHAGSKRHSFQIELAITGDQMAQGLMFRRQMAADAGILVGIKDAALDGAEAERIDDQARLEPGLDNEQALELCPHGLSHANIVPIPHLGGFGPA